MTRSTDQPAPDVRSRSILRDLAFVRLWTGTTASGLAAWALPFVLGLAVLERSLTAPDLGMVLAVRTVGFLVAVTFGGVLSDRYSRRAVIWWASLAAAVALPIMATGLGRSLPVVAATAAVAGAGQGACRPAYQALLAEVIDLARRQSANAAITLAVRVTTLVAPGLTALLATVLGSSALLIGIGALWLIAAIAPSSGTHAGSSADARRNLFGEFVDGLREARRHPWFLAGLAALTAVIATGYSATGVVLPMVSRDRYGSEVVLATATAAYTAGALAGALLVARWRPANPGWVGLGALACYGFVPLSLMLPVHPVVVVTAYVLAGMGIELFNVPWFTATQREVEPTKLARVSSVDFLLSYGLDPIGLAVIAPAIDVFGVPAVLGICTLVCFLAPAAAALVPTSRTFSRPSGSTGDIATQPIQKSQASEM